MALSVSMMPDETVEIIDLADPEHKVLGRITLKEKSGKRARLYFDMSDRTRVHHHRAKKEVTNP